MGFIREPIEIDFTLVSKTWTAEEEKEFSELIKRQKSKHQWYKINALDVEMEDLALELA
jgi:hypothetical protein